MTRRSCRTGGRKGIEVVQRAFEIAIAPLDYDSGCVPLMDSVPLEVR
jgi:hypothetical protein